MTVCALILAYDNFEGLVEVIENLRSQTRPPDFFLVVDNASSDDTPKIKSLFPEIKYVRLSENLGSAGGYKSGLKTAAEMADAVFISDDDVLYENSSLKTLSEFMSRAAEKEKIGAARCAWENFRSPAPLKVETSGWTGVLLSSQVIRTEGLPREDFFIYGEDIEYFVRMAEAGYSFYAVPGSGYLERPSGHKVKRGLWRINAEAYRGEFRLYYAFRNEIYTYLLHRRYFGVLKVLLYFVKCSLFFKGFSRVNAMFSGLRDGFAGRLGKNGRYPADRKK